MRSASILALLAGCSWIYSPPSNGTGDDAGASLDSAGGDAGRPPAPLAGVTQIAAGAHHSCAIAGGELYCWGQNGYGQLGVGDNAQRLYATRVVGFEAPVEAVTAGAGHTCAIAGGDLYCWGSGSFGALGLRAQSDELTPQRVDLAGVRAVFASQGGMTEGRPRSHTCAITSGHDLFCWGSNSQGQVGDGSQVDTADPVQVASLTQVTSVALGAKHTCAVAQDKVHCWGNGNEYQLGQDNQDSSPVPLQVAGLTGTTRLTASQRGTCAVLPASVSCWGQNLGDGLGIIGWEIGLPTDSDHHRSLQLGTQSGCSFEGQDVACWGNNLHASFAGDDSSRMQLPTVLPISEEVTAAALGYNHACFLFADQTVRCSGSLPWLGIGADAAQRTPMLVEQTAAAVELTLGWFGGCTMQAGSTWCWGLNPSGRAGAQLAQRWSTGSYVGGLELGGASSSTHASCGIADEAAYCWGSDTNGELGTGLGDMTGPSPLPVAGLDGLTVLDVAAGHLAACAVVNDAVENAAYCWGNTATRRLGVSGSSIKVEPVVVPGLTDAVDIELSRGGGRGLTGNVHGCAILGGPGSGIRCWGANGSGQLGVAGAGDDPELPQLVEDNPCVGDEKTLALGGEHSCLLCGSGEVYCWGDNARGQLGTGNTTPKWTPKRVVSLPAATSIAAGTDHTCAIAGGDLYCWGTNASGQLGVADPSDQNKPQVAEIELPGVPESVAAAGPDPHNARYFSGHGTTCVRFDGGEVYCWGDGSNGQLADAAARHESTPQTVLVQE